MDNEDDLPEVVAAKWDYRMARWNEITKQQFQLSYFGTIPYDVSNDMSVHEREQVFRLLVEQKNIEKANNEEAIKKAKASRAASKPRRSHRRKR